MSGKKFKQNSGEGVPVQATKKDTTFNDLMATPGGYNKKGAGQKAFADKNKDYKKKDFSAKPQNDWTQPKGNNINNRGGSFKKNFNNSDRNNSNYSKGGQGYQKNSYSNNSRGGKPAYGNRGNSRGGGDRSMSRGKNSGQGEGYAPKDGGQRKQFSSLTAKVNASKTVNSEERVQCIQEVLETIGENLDKIAIKKSGSRLIQSCQKTGNRAQREEVFQSLIATDLAEIILSKYGQFIIKKLLIYISDKTMRKALSDCMSENFWKFLQSENAIRALHDYLERLSDLKRLKFFEDKFSDENIQKVSIEETATFIRDKVIPQKLYIYSPIQYLMFYYWDKLEVDDVKLMHTEFQEQIELLITSSKNCGIYLACKMFDASTLKEQKKLITTNCKNNMQHLFELNPNVVQFFIKVIISFDDSHTQELVIVSFIKENFGQFLEKKETLSLMLYLVNGDYDREFFNKQVNRITQDIRDLIVFNTGKKPVEQKLKEVRKLLFNQETINQCLDEDFKEHSFQNSQFCVFIGLVLQRLVLGNYFILLYLINIFR